jgi:hypothetical protein
MAPKARRKPTAANDEWYCEAVKRLAAVYGSIEEAETALIGKLAAGELTYSYLDGNGARVPGDRRFFSDHFLRTSWDENWADRRWPVTNPAALLPDGMPSKMIAIRVAIPAGPDPTKRWIAAEVERMTQDGKIPAGISITEFARLLAGRMQKAAKADSSIHPVGWGHIKNMLPGLGLWPIK